MSAETNRRLAFERLVHSDWSVNAWKRWSAYAVRAKDGGWRVERLEQTPAADALLDDLLGHGALTLAGFDFPIGLPLIALDRIEGEFHKFVCSQRAQRFLEPVETLCDVSPEQPFYRRHPRGCGHGDLTRKLACADFDDLLRECDRRTANRLRAESIFWAVGPKQVSKAALAGWREVLIPALARGAALWPFDGTLEEAPQGHVLTIAETYPAEVYQHIGMRQTIGKRTQAGRKDGCAAMLAWADANRVAFSTGIEQAMRDGFGPRADGEDAFDALAGLCGMIEVADGRRAEAPTMPPLSYPREGWILGQIDLPRA